MSAAHVRLGVVPSILRAGLMTIVAALLLTSTAMADDKSFDELARDLRKAYRAADYKKALEAAGKMHELRSDDVDTIYNIACLHALLNERNEAYNWLHKAIDAGFRDVDHLLADKDFRLIEGEDRFRAVARRIRDLKAAEGKPDSKGDAKKKTAETPKPGIADLSVPEHGTKVQELTSALIRSAQEDDDEKALKLALEALEHAEAIRRKLPKDNPDFKRPLSMTHYNVACMYSRLKREDDAIKHLSSAIEFGGFSDRPIAEEIEDDPDFDNIRKHARYKELLKSAKDAKPAAGAPAGRVVHPSADKPKISDVNPDLTPGQRAQRIDQLTEKVFRASQEGKIEEGLAAAREALTHAEYLKEHHGDDASMKDRINNALSLTNYNYSCMLARSGKIDEAFAPLQKSVELGGFTSDMVAQIEGDTDFDSLRKDQRYAAIIERARSKPNIPQELKERAVDFKWKITLPPNHDRKKKAPLIVALHHFHGSMDGATERWQRAAAEVGAILLTPQGTIQLDEGGTLFSWGNDFHRIEDNVLDAINQAMDSHAVDERKVVVGGFSQGGWAAWNLALRNPDMFCGLIPVCGAARTESPAVYEDKDLARLRVFVMLGEQEKTNVIDSNVQAANRLREAGAKVELVKYPGVGHGFPENSTEELVRALRHVLGT